MGQIMIEKVYSYAPFLHPQKGSGISLGGLARVVEGETTPHLEVGTWEGGGWEWLLNMEGDSRIVLKICGNLEALLWWYESISIFSGWGRTKLYRLGPTKLTRDSFTPPASPPSPFFFSFSFYHPHHKAGFYFLFIFIFGFDLPLVLPKVIFTFFHYYSPFDHHHHHHHHHHHFLLYFLCLTLLSCH